MGRRRGLDIHGIVLLDKPAGISSNEALQKVRAIFEARKAGHTGSLDPFATGMLPLCLGEASKTAAFMLQAAKRYRASARFGEATTTGDIAGEVILTGPVPPIGDDDMAGVRQRFSGEILQVPPMYSALKREGKPLYEYARAGIELERPARVVTVHRLDLLEWRPPRLTFEVRCSKGTYIRTLAEDIAKHLGSCAHLVELRRLAVDPFAEHAMVTLEALREARERGQLQDMLLPVDAGLSDWPRVGLDFPQQEKFMHGNRFPYPAEAPRALHVRVYGAREVLLGLAVLEPEGVLRPVRVFNL